MKQITILDRYLGTEFLKSFFLSLVGLVVIFTTFTAIENLRIETKQAKIHVYLYILYSIPQLTSHIIPMALMFAVCFTVAQFTVSREMVAIHSAGISFFRAIATILICGFLLSMIQFFFQNFVVTPANEAAANEMEIVKKGVGTIKDLVWQKNLRGKKGYYFIYFFDRPNNRIVGGFNYLDMEEDRPVQMIQAAKAQYFPATQDWVLSDVRLLNFENTPRLKNIERIPELRRSFPDDINFFFTPTRDPMELNLIELREEIEFRESRGYTALPYRVQFHANIALPVMCIVVAVIGSIAGGAGSHRSGGPLIKSLLMMIITIFVYQLTFRLGQNLGTGGIVPPAVAAWSSTGIFIVVAGVLVWQVKR